jgi:hypothetical protein
MKDASLIEENETCSRSENLGTKDNQFPSDGSSSHKLSFLGKSRRGSIPTRPERHCGMPYNSAVYPHGWKASEHYHEASKIVHLKDQ